MLEVEGKESGFLLIAWNKMLLLDFRQSRTCHPPRFPCQKRSSRRGRHFRLGLFLPHALLARHG